MLVDTLRARPHRGGTNNPTTRVVFLACVRKKNILRDRQIAILYTNTPNTLSTHPVALQATLYVSFASLLAVFDQKCEKRGFTHVLGRPLHPLQLWQANSSTASVTSQNCE
jgi:hypothetical protein